MTQYFTDFSEYALNAQPPDWTRRWNTDTTFTVVSDAAASNGVAAEFIVTGTTSTHRIVTWNALDSDVNRANAEVLVKFKSSAAADHARRLRVLTRGSNPTATRNGYVIGQSGNGASPKERIVKYVGGAFTDLVSGSAITIPVDTWAFVKVRTIDSALKMKVWLATDPEPELWSKETTDTSLTAAGWIGQFLYDVSTQNRMDFFGVGTNGDPAPTGPVSAGNTGDTTGSSAANDSWSALCASAVATTANAMASDSLSVIASINTSIISAAQASDTSGDSPAANVSLQSAATGSDSVGALASAAAALSAGAAAGESWTVQAQVVANLLDQAAASDQIVRATESAINAALTEGSAASDQFIAAINTLCSLQDSASVSDALIAAVVTIAGISSGAVASDSFGVNFGQIKNIESGAISTDAWILAATLSAALSEVCTASEIMTARADVTNSVTFGAIASDTFAIVNQGIQYLVMGAITLRTALNQSITTRTALNQTANIKPGH